MGSFPKLTVGKVGFSSDQVLCSLGQGHKGDSAAESFMGGCDSVLRMQFVRSRLSRGGLQDDVGYCFQVAEDITVFVFRESDA
jgi:hypothetical protein